MESLEDRRVLAALTVNTNVDELAFGNSTLTLRETIAVVQAGTTAGLGLSAAELAQINTSGGFGSNDTVTFASSLNGATITLNRAFLGEISFGKSLTIDASGLAAGITIDADDPSATVGNGIRIFNITDPTSGTNPPLVTMIGLMLRGADPPNPFGVPSQGGAIRSAGMLTLQEMVIVENGAGFGAGVYLAVAAGGSGNREVLKIENSTIKNNSASQSGGGLFLQLSSTSGSATQTARIISSTLTENTTATPFEHNRGGALRIQGNAAPGDHHAVIITSSQFESNEAGNGGAIYHEGTRVDLSILEGSVVSGNEALTGRSGGIHSDIFDSQLQIENSIVSGNHADDPTNGHGGGVFARLIEPASLAIVESEVSGNTAGNDGGGIRVDMPGFGHTQANGSLFTVQRSLVEGNRASNRGGGLFTTTGSGGQVVVQESIITGNDAGITLLHGAGQIPNSGGGMYAYLFSNQNPATLTIAGTEFSGNTAGQHGGGLLVCTKRQDSESAISRVSVYNSTISGNQAGHTTAANDPGTGGGAHLAIFPIEDEEALDARFQNVTITDNTADQGGGVWSFVPTLSGARNDVRLTNSIASENRQHDNDPNNLYGSYNIAQTVYNLIGSGNTVYDHITHQLTTLSSQNIFTDNPMLGPLQSNGGPTATHALLFGSPAIDVGSDALAIVPFTTTVLTTDQRGTGFTRKYDFPGINNGMAGSVDIGAYELTELCVSTTTDEFDTDLSYGDLSLREAVNYANTAGVPLTVCLPAGVYSLTLSGAGGVSQGDLDITGNVTIVGDGPGETIIDGGGTTNDRIFDVASGATLNVSLVTLTLGDTPNGTDGGAIRVQNGGTMNLDYSAIVSSTTGSGGDGAAIYFAATGSGSIRNSVITVNEADDIAGGVRLASATAGTGGTVIVGNTIIAKNTDGGGSTPDVYAGINRSFTSEGNNRLGNATTGFTNGVNGDIVGTPDYIVTTLADTYDGLSDPVSMSLRDAIHQANITPGAQEIWLPAWNFVLTRERTAAPNSPELDISQGDLDITDSLVIRGIGTATSVEWSPGVMDRVFELVGDYNGDGEVDAADWTVWRDTKGSTPDPGAVTADGDDDGDIDDDDEDIWTAYYGNTFDLF